MNWSNLLDGIYVSALFTFIGFYAGKLADELEKTDPQDAL